MHTRRNYLLGLPADSQDGCHDTLKTTLITCLAISCVFVALRSGARWLKIRKMPFLAEDICIYVGLVSFAAMCALYLFILPKLHRIDRVAAGLAPPYAGIKADAVVILKGILTIEILFWCALWGVKFSFLFMFRKLTIGLSTYTKVWWGVMTFTILTFITCQVSILASCSSMHAWFSPDDECNTRRDNIARAVSLWYSFAADLLTDLTIMTIPIHILCRIRISTLQKFSAGIVFTVGVITIIVSIVRVVVINDSIKEGSVSTLWSVIEAAVALMVGCLPSFAIFIRARVDSGRKQYFRTSPQVLSRTDSNMRSTELKSSTRVGSFVFEDDIELQNGSRDGGNN